MKTIDTRQLVQAALEFAAEHSQEDAYQSVTQLLATKQITQDQWHEVVQALYSGVNTEPR